MERWCREHQLVPANGQASERVSERSIRYYRTLGLLDAPEAGGGFTEIHRLQLIALRILQTEGLPLRRIRALLHGRTRKELVELQTRAGRSTEIPSTLGMPGASGVVPGLPLNPAETWKVMPIDDEFALVSRRGREVDAETLRAIRQLLAANDSKKGGCHE